MPLNRGSERTPFVENLIHLTGEDMGIKSNVLGVALSVLAAGVGANTHSDRIGAFGDGARSQTERWLQLQREGNAGSTQPQAATPAERELASQRWLDSYKHSIPAFFEQGVEGSVGK
ncbi:DUF3613 domain-containing protein [Zobellella iuensis]|uniref:DUF3613 domain-containing protein n=1 Tax=Zobellella iuensis TaxID=2803811 RepID=A0ABS1QP14_9GAMM|nr:DUF3613 domain-containing protein [Zobellella iuensis]MBL1376599.1 DUF3613 domain-containing protein [Zobellella iuensis]